MTHRTELVAQLRAVATWERAEKEKAYLESDLEHLGVTVPEVRKVAKAFAKDHPMDRAALLALVDDLWQDGIFELRSVAVELLTRRVRDLQPDDFPRLETLLRNAHTWALVDPLSIAVVGGMVESLADTLDRWVRGPT